MMADFQNTIDLLGDDVVARKIADRTIEEYVDDRLTSVGARAFCACSNLTRINLPLATNLGEYAFYNCKKLTSANIPSVTKTGSHVFAGCRGLTSVDFPVLSKIESFMFNDCENLASVNIPLAGNIGTGGVQGCEKLAFVDLPSVISIYSRAFKECPKLSTIILRKETVCSLNAVDAVAETPFAAGGTGGTVYVPQALIEQYQTATNWSTLYAAGTCNFVAIEGSEYE